MKKISLFILTLILSVPSFSQLTDLKIEFSEELSANRITASYVSFDGTKMVFVYKTKDKIYKLYEREKTKDNKWAEPTEIESVNNFQGGEKYINAPVYNYDATEIYFEAEYNESANIDIYYIEKTKTAWSQPIRLDAPINTTKYDGEPCLSADNTTLYFVRELPENKDNACKKIFVSTKDKNGLWQEPVALLEPLNLDCERCPRILSDNKTLIFSSIRGENKTGFDLFYAKKFAKGIWRIPQLITELSTENDDLYPSVSFGSEAIYYSQISKKSECIFTDKFPKNLLPDNSLMLNGKITDLYTNKPIKAEITVYNPKTSKIIYKFNSNEYTGEYQIYLSPEKEYLIDFSGEGYSHTYYIYDKKQINDNRKLEFDVKLFSEINLQLNIYDKAFFEPVKTDIIVRDGKTKNKITCEINELAKGRYNLKLPIGIEYDILLNTAFFEAHNLSMDLSKIVLFDKFERDIELTSKKREITFLIFDEETGEGVSVEIKITNKNTNEEYVTTATTDKNGKVTVKVREGDKYDIAISPRGYAFYHTSFDLKTDTELSEMVVELKPLNQDTKFELENITFETNSAELNASSYSELTRVIELMATNPNMKIELSAHTDDVGSEAYNLKLSERRSQSVVNYLTDNGIIISRLIPKGYGESEPIAPNDTEENKLKNRRVELKIVEI